VQNLAAALFRVALAVLLAVFADVSLAATPVASAQVLIVLSADAAIYEDVAQAFQAGLTNDRGLRIETATAAQLSTRTSPLAYELVVAVGSAAAEAVIARSDAMAQPPYVLCLLIPRQAFDALAASRGGLRGRRISALYLDQPISRQLDLMRLALPNATRVSALLGSSSRPLAGELRDAGRQRGLTVVTADIADSSGVYAGLREVLPNSDALLALPDPVVFNASTAYGLLLTTYRAQVPVVGFSEALVKAGALVGLYSSSKQVGAQGAEMASRALAPDGALPPPQWPRQFTVRVNYSVARSLGIVLPDEAMLAAALVAAGKAP
jgi:ABC-type uncharacterized transport system substrate-binding protein